MSRQPDDAPTAEVLSHAEQRAYRERLRPRPAPARSWPGLSLDLPPLSAEMRAELKGLLREAKEAMGELKPWQRRKRSGRPAQPKPNPIDAAIARARERELLKARQTPERLWTPAMREAVRAAERKR